MPYKQPRPCRRQPCAALTRDPNGYCEAHKTETRQIYDRARGNSARRGYGAGHRRRRLFVLRRDPLCVECLKRGIVRASKEADHIIPLPEGPDTVENMQGLCKPCHSRKTQSENSGR